MFRCPTQRYVGENPQTPLIEAEPRHSTGEGAIAMDEPKLTAAQRQLLADFDSLTDSGKQMLLKLAASFKLNPEYVRGGASPA